MPIAFEVTDQHDFTAGEIDPAAKRANDNPFVKAGMRQLLNGRVLNTKGVTNRQGRSALQVLGGNQVRVEEVLMAPGVKYRLAFNATTSGIITIYDASGAQVNAAGGFAWTSTTLNQITWAVYLKQVFITFPGQRPIVLTWDGGVTWVISSFAEFVIGNQKRTPFYRISPQGVTMLPSATVGGITLQTSAAYFVAGMVGTRIRFVGRQILITAVADQNNASGVVLEPLPGTQGLDFGAIDPTAVFVVGDLVKGTESNAEGVVIQFAGGGSGNGMVVQLLTLGTSAGTSEGNPVTQAFINSDTIVSAAGSAPIVGASGIRSPPGAVTVWDEEVMNAFRGWPASVAADQGRVIFSNFPSVPGGISWSAFGSPTDLNIGANPSDGMFELAPGKSQVLYVQAGPESSEFVFCDNAIYYIPISATNPLKPGSVAFQLITSDGCAANVQPRAVQEIILYANAAKTAIRALVAIGAYNRPYESRPLTDLHSHLFNNIQAIAAPSAADQNFLERYAYVLNGDGAIALGRYTINQNGQLDGFVGWNPWNGKGSVASISALGATVLFVTIYAVNAAAVLEQIDATQYLDASIPINAVPTALAPPGGKGPLWWLPSTAVDLMDGTLPFGPHAVDANGFIAPNQPGEDLSSVTLRAGFTWTAVFEPFLPPVSGGQDAGQRMKKRRCAQFEVYVTNSSGFAERQIVTEQQGPNLPAIGSYYGGDRVTAYNQNDDATKPPPLREQAYCFRPLGRAHDPRVAIVKDTPGPLTVVEISTRVTV